MVPQGNETDVPLYENKQRGCWQRHQNGLRVCRFKFAGGFSSQQDALGFVSGISVRPFMFGSIGGVKASWALDAGILGFVAGCPLSI